MDFFNFSVLASELRFKPAQARTAMHDIITLILITVAIPIIALVIFLSFAKPKRRRRPLSNVR